MLFAVFDGHGPENGMLVAQVAAKTVQEYVVARFSQLSSTPETVFSTAFELAHNAVLDAVLQARLVAADSQSCRKSVASRRRKRSLMR